MTSTLEDFERAAEAFLLAEGWTRWVPVPSDVVPVHCSWWSDPQQEPDEQRDVSFRDAVNRQWSRLTVVRARLSHASIERLRQVEVLVRGPVTVETVANLRAELENLASVELWHLQCQLSSAQVRPTLLKWVELLDGPLAQTFLGCARAPQLDEVLERVVHRLRGLADVRDAAAPLNGDAPFPWDE